MSTASFERLMTAVLSGEQAPSDVAESSGVEQDREYFLADRIAERLATRVVRQERAVRTLGDLLSISLSGLRMNQKRPRLCVLLNGSTGVGKTEMARAVADLAFEVPVPLIRIDMTEYQTPLSVNRLIGPPPGTVGFDQSRSWLTTQVAAQPRSVILLDELEKAAPEVIQAFLPVLDVGRLTDARGVTAAFSECVVMMTSNLGVADAAQASFGFRSASSTERTERSLEAVRRTLAPEMISRLDGIVQFEQFDTQDLAAVARVHLDAYCERIAQSGRRLSINDEVVAAVTSGASDIRFGFRHREREMERRLLPGLVGKAPGSYRAVVEDGIVRWIGDDGAC